MSQDLDNLREEYTNKVKAILDKLAIEYPNAQLSELNPFDVAFDFYNQSPRIGADSLKESLVNVGATTQEPASLPKFLSATKIADNSAFKNWYLRRTEPLINDRVFILISNHENDIKAQLKKAGTKEEKAELTKKLAEIRAEKKAYIEYMEEYRIALLEKLRDDFIDNLIKKADGDEATQELLRKIKTIKRSTPSGEEGSLQSCADCLESYGLHQSILDELEKKGVVSKEEIATLRNLCNHHNDVAYLKPQIYTKLEIFYAGLRAVAPVLGLILLILGAVGVIPSLGASSPMLAAGVALVLSPAIIEGLGHAIHAAYRKRAPDFGRMVELAVGIGVALTGFALVAVGPALSLVIHSPQLLQLTQEVIAAVSALIPRAIVRQLYAGPRQTLKDFAFNCLDFPAVFLDFASRATVAIKQNKANVVAMTPIIGMSKSSVTTMPTHENKLEKSGSKPVTINNFLDAAMLREGVKILMNLIKSKLHHSPTSNIRSTLLNKWHHSKEAEKQKVMTPEPEVPVNKSGSEANKEPAESGKEMVLKATMEANKYK